MSAVASSAADVIERIKKLPREELLILQEFFETDFRAQLASPDPNGLGRASDANFQKVSDEVFTRFDGLLKRLAK